MNPTNSLQLFFRDFKLSIQNYQNVLPFIKTHQLWKGMLDYGWVTKFVFIVGALLGIKFYSLFQNWVIEQSNNGLSVSSLVGLVSETYDTGYNLFVMGGFKYVILILLEIVIFHFARKTLQVLTGTEQNANLQAFITAQVRMIKVVIAAYFMEMVFSILAGSLISMAGLGVLKPVVHFGIQCFFLGFVIIDNYNEIYHMKINQSFKYTQQYMGVAIAIGIVVYVLMLIPVFGTVLAPLLGAVVATITMHQLEQDDDSMEAIFENE